MEAAKGADDPVVPRYVFSSHHYIGERAESTVPESISMLQTNRPSRMASQWMH